METNLIKTIDETQLFLNNLPKTKFNYKEILISYSEIISENEKNSKESIIENKELINSNLDKPKSNSKRPGIPWSNEEVEAIRLGIEKFGVGKWAKILEEYKEVFNKNLRRSGDLGDKWKNLKNKIEFKKFLEEKPKENENLTTTEIV